MQAIYIVSNAKYFELTAIRMPASGVTDRTLHSRVDTRIKTKLLRLLSGCGPVPEEVACRAALGMRVRDGLAREAVLSDYKGTAVIGRDCWEREADCYDCHRRHQRG